ncbi:hypothetical protein Peur_048140 [Populus x canadensis]
MEEEGECICKDEHGMLLDDEATSTRDAIKTGGPSESYPPGLRLVMARGTRTAKPGRTSCTCNSQSIETCEAQEG